MTETRLSGLLIKTGSIPVEAITNFEQSIITGLPTGTVSSSAQVDYNSIQNKLSGVVSSSTQVKPLLPGGTVTSSAQFPGWVTSSAQIDYNSIQNKLSGVVSSSAQVQPLLPAGTVSSSAQVTITATTGYSTFSSSISTVDTEQTLRINNLASLTSSYAINSTIQSQLAGVVSSSTQIKPLLPGGTVTSSAQFSGWVTSSAQINYNLIQNKLSGVVSSSAQVKPLLPGGTVTSSAQFPGWVTSSGQIDYNSIQNKLSGVYSSSAFTSPSQGTARLTLNGVALTDVDLGLQSGDSPIFSGSQFSGIVSGSGTEYRLVVPVGTDLYAT